MKLLLLYMELADYTVTSLKELKRQNPEIEIHTVAYPVNEEAPFQFDFSEIGHLYNRAKFDHEKIQLFSDKLKPDVIICSGWTDRSYLKVIRTWKNKARTVLCMDNKWLGTLKQRVACFGARFYLPKIFDFIWVPYKNHAEFARRMGFSESSILLGFYSADLSIYNALYDEATRSKKNRFPKVFICVARYIQAKNLDLLWDAFIEAQEETQKDWELWNLGQGELFEQRKEHAKIVHHGFVQPKKMTSLMKRAGVFVLSSLQEPWGVVVHQFAASGFPLLLSNNVGAHEAFLKHGENGFLFNPKDKNQLKDYFVKIMNTEESDLWQMAQKSHELGQMINTQNWVNHIKQISES